MTGYNNANYQNLQRQHETRNVGKRWTAELDRSLASFANNPNTPLSDIARTFGRTENGIRMRLQEINHPRGMVAATIPSAPLTQPTSLSQPASNYGSPLANNSQRLSGGSAFASQSPSQQLSQPSYSQQQQQPLSQSSYITPLSQAMGGSSQQLEYSFSQTSNGENSNLAASSATNNMQRWTTDDHNYLLQALKEGIASLATMAARVGRTERAVKMRLEQFAIIEKDSEVIGRAFGPGQSAKYSGKEAPKMGQKWTPADDEILRSTWLLPASDPSRSMFALTEKLGRSDVSIIMRMEEQRFIESRLDRARRQRGARMPAFISAVSAPISNSNSSSACGAGVAVSCAAAPTPSTSAAATAAPTTVSAVVAAVGVKRERETAASDEADMCDVCMDGKKDTAFIPCGHRVCGSCATALSKCHICRTDITSRLKIY